MTEHTTPPENGNSKPAASWQTYSPKESLNHVRKLPAFRDSLLYGIGAGALAGLVRYVRRRTSLCFLLRLCSQLKMWL